MTTTGYNTPGTAPPATPSVTRSQSRGRIPRTRSWEEPAEENVDNVVDNVVDNNNDDQPGHPTTRRRGMVTMSESMHCTRSPSLSKRLARRTSRPHPDGTTKHRILVPVTSLRDQSQSRHHHYHREDDQAVPEDEDGSQQDETNHDHVAVLHPNSAAGSSRSGRSRSRSSQHQPSGGPSIIRRSLSRNKQLRKFLCIGTTWTDVRRDKAMVLLHQQFDQDVEKRTQVDTMLEHARLFLAARVESQNEIAIAVSMKQILKHAAERRHIQRRLTLLTQLKEQVWNGACSPIDFEQRVHFILHPTASNESSGSNDNNKQVVGEEDDEDCIVWNMDDPQAFLAQVEQYCAAVATDRPAAVAAAATVAANSDGSIAGPRASASSNTTVAVDAPAIFVSPPSSGDISLRQRSTHAA